MKLIKQINWSLVVLWPLPSTTLCWIFRQLCRLCVSLTGAVWHFIFYFMMWCVGQLAVFPSLASSPSHPASLPCPRCRAMRGRVKHCWEKSCNPLPPLMARTFVVIVNQHKGCRDGGRRWEFWQWSLQSSLDFWRISLTEDWTSKEG